MRAVIIFVHPEPRSFNGALRDVAVETLGSLGHEVEVSDLHAVGFDPVEAAGRYAGRRDPDRFRPQGEQRHAWERGATPPEVQAEIDRLRRADLVLFQYPIWWFSMPAMLKGWLDRVLIYGGVYTGAMRFENGAFRGKRALLSVTCGSPPATQLHDGRNGDIDLLLWPMHYTLHYVGFRVLPPFVATGVGPGAGDRLAEHLAALRRHLSTLDERAPIPFNTAGDWDGAGRLLPGSPSHSPFIRHAPLWSSAEPAGDAAPGESGRGRTASGGGRARGIPRADPGLYSP